MSCIFKKEENGGLTATLALKRSQLLYDIENAAYIEGITLPEEATGHNRHIVQDIGEKGNVDRATRVINLEMARVREILYPYTKHKIHQPELTDDLREPEIYGIVLDLPQTFSQTTLSLLERLIHEYLVCRVMEDWLGMTYPAKAELWAAKAREAETRIRTGMNVRMRPLRKRQHLY